MGFAKSNFCVNDKESGSCWGFLVDWAEADKIARSTSDEFYTDPNKCIRYEKNLHDWNGKTYAWLKNYSNGDNLFVDLK